MYVYMKAIGLLYNIQFSQKFIYMSKREREREKEEGERERERESE